MVTMKKIIFILLVMSLILATFAACKDKTPTAGDVATTASTLNIESKKNTDINANDGATTTISSNNQVTTNAPTSGSKIEPTIGSTKTNNSTNNRATFISPSNMVTTTQPEASITSTVTTSPPVLNESLIFKVLETTSFVFKSDVDKLRLVKSRQELIDVFSMNEPSLNAPKVNEKYSDAYFNQKFILVMAGHHGVGADEQSIDKILLKDDKLITYSTLLSIAPPISTKRYVLIELDNNNLENVKSLVLYNRIHIEPANVNEPDYVKTYEGKINTLY